MRRPARRLATRRHAPPLWRRLAGPLLLLASAGLVVTGGALLVTGLLPAPGPERPPDQGPPLQPTARPLQPATEVRPAPGEAQGAAMPTIAPVATAVTGYQFTRDLYEPFTVIPERRRSEVIQYTIARGDTVIGIAERFGLEPNTIAWSNQRSVIQSLRPGRVLDIPPVDGVYHTVIGSRSIGEIARSYHVADPWLVIDSGFNQLFGATPETVLPSGTQILIPGGEAEQIAWTPTVSVPVSVVMRTLSPASMHIMSRVRTSAARASFGPIPASGMAHPLGLEVETS